MGGCQSRVRRKSEGKLRGLSAPTDTGAGETVRAKLVFLGSSNAGKSSIVQRFTKGDFSANPRVTMGASFVSQTIWAAGRSVTFEIWDTAGQERFASLAPLYYRGASAACVVYDIASKSSFQKARVWVKELQKHAAAGIVIALVGNKCDLEEHREVSTEEAAEFAEQNDMHINLDVSAKTGHNVEQLFFDIAAALQKAPPAAAEGTAAAAAAA
mmetsp:Transcript_30628/g.99576  ORF Transcript_30628/g.99576 Transcript_30628/m.99576 type:complete len:213 (-) Transcript_30628:1887-2525(-)